VHWERILELAAWKILETMRRASRSVLKVGGYDAGVHIRAVADLLGHSSISITGDIYGHTSDETARAAIEGLSGALGL
jgi:integrase